METLQAEPSAADSIGKSFYFRTTHWSVVLEAGQSDSARAPAALAELCQTYWYPLYAYVRRLGHRPEDAQDLTQEFFARLIAKQSFRGVTPEKGKFRCFLVVALKRFLANEWEKAGRQKRGGHPSVVSLDETGAEERYQAELADYKTPEMLWDRCWANTVLQLAFRRLEAGMQQEGKGALFQELKHFLGGQCEPNAYAAAAGRLGMSEGNLRVNIHRLRQRYRDLLRAEIAETVNSAEAVNEELRHLFAVLS